MVPNLKEQFFFFVLLRTLKKHINFVPSKHKGAAMFDN